MAQPTRTFNLLSDQYPPHGYPTPPAANTQDTLRLSSLDLVAPPIKSVDATYPSPVEHPPHYTSHPSGVECIQITEHMNFNVGNAIKYLWRCDQKGKHLEDLKKARWYIDREIQLRERNATK